MKSYGMHLFLLIYKELHDLGKEGIIIILILNVEESEASASFWVSLYSCTLVRGYVYHFSSLAMPGKLRV